MLRFREEGGACLGRWKHNPVGLLTCNASDVSVRQMKTVPLRTLLRDPKSVKKLTGGGHSVRITDGGVALWDLSAPSVNADTDEAERNRLWDEHFDDLMDQPLHAAGMPSLDQVLELSRGDR